MLRSKLSSLREYLTPINHNSNFERTGEISPEEFVKAGDYLVYKFPTWQWGNCPKNLQKSFLPPDKQFLITRHVPSYRRASAYLGITSELEEEEEEELEDGWVKSHRLEKIDKSDPTEEKEIDDIEDLVDESAEINNTDDEYVDEDEDLEFISNNNNQLRKYDLYITYSTSYRVPKLYLVGFNSDGIPLLPKQMLEDIQSDYKDKTATIEDLPVSYNTTSISIHPCKHSSVMKVLMQHSKARDHSAEVATELNKLTINENSEDVEELQGLRSDQYMIVFLKFIASVTPGIEYDYTMDAL